jgi:superfamily I DNA/RNA helicase
MAYYFNLPVITSLTKDQQAAVDETESLALSGGPGTGKSVVCLWRHIRNYSTGTSRSLLLTYTKTLEHYLRQSAGTQNKESADNINRTLWWVFHDKRKYDEIIIDEGQDVSVDNYDIIKKYADNISYGADEAQSLYDHGSTFEQLLTAFPNNEEYTLYRNFRNSKEILQFTKSLFPKVLIPQDTVDGSEQTGLKPILKIVGWDEETMIQSIVSIINDFAADTHNIGIIVPSQKDVDKYYELINAEIDGKDFSKYQGEMNDFEGLEGIHITTFKSSKGTEFDTVIIPNFDRFDWLIANTNKKITEKDYYVALTRTKTNLFLICKNFPNKGARATYDIE